MKHGEEYAYRKGCRCDECRSAQSRRAKSRHYEFRDTGSQFIPAGPVQNHVLYLRAHRMNNAAIAACAGLPQRTVNSHALGRCVRIQRRTADAILSVTAGDVPNDGLHWVDADPARTLIREMVRAGVGWDVLETKFRIPKRGQLISTLTRKRVVLVYRYLARQGIVPASVLDEVNA